MKVVNSALRHYEENVQINAATKDIFSFVDDHSLFSSHMSKSSWMMGGGRMNILMDNEKGQRVGSHIRLKGNVFGVNLFLDEVITRREPPIVKEWKTVGDIRLLIIGHYRMGFEIKPQNNSSMLKVFIDYDLPISLYTRWLGVLLGRIYAKWCIRQMITGVKEQFK